MKKINNNKNSKPTDSLSQEVGKIVRETRKLRGLSQRQLAESLGTQQPSIARIESGMVLPSLGFLGKIADSLDIRLQLISSLN